MYEDEWVLVGWAFRVTSHDFDSKSLLSFLLSGLIFFFLQSHNDEEMSEGEADSAREHEDVDSCDEIRRHAGLLADHGDVLAKLKMQVRDIKVQVNKRTFLNKQ